MKNCLSFAFLFVCFSSFSQMSGELPESGRKLLSPYSFSMLGTKEGLVVLDVVVDIDGKVLSTKVVPAQTTIVSTPTIMKVENEVRALKFEKGYQYPKFHHAFFTVKINKSN
jgi:hypothetical protein